MTSLSPSTPRLADAERGYLDRARELAKRGWGHVHPNPMVGCLLVKDGVVVGEGYHKEFGGPHAEIVALEAARSQAEGATAYVTLEPCNHQGKTPPCAHALLKAGIARVVYGAADPGEASGGGARTLVAGGVEVVGPVLDPALARAENPAFFHTATRRTPFVALKLAQSLDGFIARDAGGPTPITGPEAQRAVHALRSGFDAVWVGAGTARADDPRLTVRMAEPGRTPPARMVLDPRAQMPSDAAVLADAAAVPVHVFTRRDARELELERLEAVGAHVHPVAFDENGLELDAVLSLAWGLGLRALLCEGGARLGSNLLNQDLAQRIYLWLAPRALGSGVPAFPGVSPGVWDRPGGGGGCQRELSSILNEN